VWLTVYAHSLTIALFLLFVASVVLHAVGGVWVYHADQLVHGQAPSSLVGYLGSSTF
jgi:succinate dehydrogenase hydrophobic anchor subunit